MVRSAALMIDAMTGPTTVGMSIGKSVTVLFSMIVKPSRVRLIATFSVNALPAGEVATALKSPVMGRDSVSDAIGRTIGLVNSGDARVSFAVPVAMMFVLLLIVGGSSSKKATNERQSDLM